MVVGHFFLRAVLERTGQPDHRLRVRLHEKWMGMFGPGRGVPWCRVVRCCMRFVSRCFSLTVFGNVLRRKEVRRKSLAALADLTLDLDILRSAGSEKRKSLVTRVTVTLYAVLSAAPFPWR